MTMATWSRSSARSVGPAAMTDTDSTGKADLVQVPLLLPVCSRCGKRRDLAPCCDRHQHVLCRECYLLATADPINCGVEVGR